MSRKAAAVFFVVAVGLLVAGCQRKVSGIGYALDRSKVVGGYNIGWHDVNFTNNSGQDLHEVRVTVALIGDDGVPREEQKYYAAWPNGQTVQVSLSRAASPVNVQKVVLSGTCDEGIIDYSWIPSQH